MSTLSAAKIDLSEPDKFQMASVVTKNSRTGITSNKRLLVIKKGYLYYYSNVPKKFKGDSSIVQTIHELPKCSIEIVNIKQIKGYESNSSYFSIQFDAKNMLQREDIRKTMTLEEYNFSPKNTNQDIVWQFSCDNQFIKQRWVAALQGLHTFYTKQKKDIEKFFNEHKENNSEIKSSSSGGRNSHIPWRQSQSGNNSNYRKNGQVNFLKLVSSKSNDERPQNRSVSPDNKFMKSNYLNVPSNNNQSRMRGNSQNNEQSEKTDFYQNYTPEVSKKIEETQPFNESIGGGQSNFYKNSSTKKLSENSPIKNLQFSDVTKQNTHSSQILLSKTSKINLNEEIIDQQPRQSQKSQSSTPVKRMSIQQSSGYDSIQKEAKDFEENIEQLQKSKLNRSESNSKNQPFNYSGFIQHILSVKPQQNTVNFDKHQNYSLQASVVNINLNQNIQQNKSKNKEALTDRQSNFQKSLHNHSQITFPQSPEILSFYELHRYLFSNTWSFAQKISLQQHFYTKIHNFSAEATKCFIEYVESISQQNRNFYVFYKSNNYTLAKHKFTNTLFKIAFVTSQPLSINGQEKIYFDEEAIKNLKREFKIYNDLQEFIVLNNLKNDTSFRIRVPLTAFIEYKGVVALAMDQSYLQREDKETQINPSQQQIKKNYQKQLDIFVNEGFQLKDFSLVSSNEQNFLVVNLLPEIVNNRFYKQQAKKAYLKKLIKVKRPEKHHNLQLNPPFTEDLIIKAHETNASTSIQSLEEYVSTLDRLEQFSGICPKQEIIEILRICVFCKQIRKIYRSAQGEIHETHFLNLIFKKQPQMIKMLQQSGCDQIPQFKGVLFTFINHYLGIQCSINESAFNQYTKHNHQSKSKKTDIVLSTQIRPKVRTFDISRLELVEAYESVRKFFSEQKPHLASEAIRIIQNLHLEQFSLEMNDKRLQLAYHQASLAYLEHDFLKCIQHCKRYEKLIKNQNHPKLFDIYLLMLKSYSHFSEDELKKVFEKLMKLVEFNYGPNNSILISVYCISSFYFAQMAQQAEADQQKQSQLHILSCKLLDEAEKLSLLYFGDASSQYIDILLDMSRLYERKDPKRSQKCSQKAKNIIISTQNNQKLIDYLLFELKQSVKFKQFEKSINILNQSEQLIYSNKLKIESPKMIELMKVKFELGMIFSNEKLYMAEQAVEQLWMGDKMEEKKISVTLAAKLVKKLKIINDDYCQPFGLDSDRSLIGSIVSNLSHESSAGSKDDILVKIIDLITEQRYPMSSEFQWRLMGKIRQLIQEEQLYARDQTRREGLKRLLLQIM